MAAASTSPAVDPVSRVCIVGIIMFFSPELLNLARRMNRPVRHS
jgi:hypothetical protein